MARGKRRVGTHQECNAFAYTEDGFRLTCFRSLGHKAELCYDAGVEEEFIPDHPRVLSSKRPPRRS